jgi:hypothetical protein
MAAHVVFLFPRGARGTVVFVVLAALASACAWPSSTGPRDDAALGPVITQAQWDGTSARFAWTFDDAHSGFNVRVTRDGVADDQVELAADARSYEVTGAGGTRVVTLDVQACTKELLRPSVCTAWTHAAVVQPPP